MKDYIGALFKKNFPEVYKKILYIKQGRYNFEFSEEKYPGSFLTNNASTDRRPASAAPKIFCFWTGDNEMSDNRKRGLQSLREKAGLPVVLITPANLQDYIVKGFPLHPAYELLSLVHRSDYLRCYFMHHYGGGYADIKTFHHSWQNALKKLNKKTDKWGTGYPEVGGVAPLGGKLYEDMVFYLPLLIGNGAYIMKPYTAFTAEWYVELHKRMDDYLPKLAAYNIGTIAEYPVPYTYLLGQIFHPLTLKYHRYILQDKSLMPDFKNYH